MSDPLNVLSNGVSRWGDYSATVVDEQGCIWSAAEYIPSGPRDPFAGNWGTFITRISPDGPVCSAQSGANSRVASEGVSGVSVGAGANGLPFTSAPAPVGLIVAGALALLLLLGVVTLLDRFTLRD